MPLPTLGLIGTGAFGQFALTYLVPHFTITIYDAQADCAALVARHGVTAGDLAAAAACDNVLLAVPVQKLAEVLRAIVPYLRPGALVMDVGSVKVKPAQAMLEILPPGIDAVGLHPLFGPQSGKDGITGLKIAVCNLRGDRGGAVTHFCADVLKLRVFAVTPEQHDRELAYVHGLTHMLGKVITALDLPAFSLTTRTYELIDQAVGFIRHDSDELFKAIERENPFTAEAKEAFFAAARRLEEKLAKP